MCGRYFIDMNDQLLQAWLNHDIDFTFSGDVFPSQAALLLKLEDSLKPIALPWGFKVRHHKQLVINARSETINDLPLFKNAYRHQKAIVLASGFYEWDASKIKHRIIPKAHSLFFMAGLVQEDNQGFAILTQPASYPLSSIHDRQPIMLDQNDIEKYLKNKLGDSLVDYHKVDMKILSNITQTSLF